MERNNRVSLSAILFIILGALAIYFGLKDVTNIEEDTYPYFPTEATKKDTELTLCPDDESSGITNKVFNT